MERTNSNFSEFLAKLVVHHVLYNNNNGQQTLNTVSVIATLPTPPRNTPVMNSVSKLHFCHYGNHDVKHNKHTAEYWSSCCVGAQD